MIKSAADVVKKLHIIPAKTGFLAAQAYNHPHFREK
jgi:hypothetical protein